MPHVVLRGNVNVTDVFKELETFLVRGEKSVLRIANTFIDRDNKSILVESLVIEGSKKTQFFTMISRRKDGVVIRIAPIVEVEKSYGVKKIIAVIATQILAKFPQLSIGETNLSEFFSARL
ncbi:hypothetical protein [[Eubacterium] cellulosolvens]